MHAWVKADNQVEKPALNSRQRKAWFVIGVHTRREKRWGAIKSEVKTGFINWTALTNIEKAIRSRGEWKDGLCGYWIANCVV